MRVTVGGVECRVKPRKPFANARIVARRIAFAHFSLPGVSA